MVPEFAGSSDMIRQAGLVPMLGLLLGVLPVPGLADSRCQTLQGEIDAKIRASGVTVFTLLTVDTSADVPGRVVGSCGQGSKKIVYLTGVTAAAPGRPASAPAPAGKVVSTVRAAPILTECKDGSVTVGGDCKP
jgi:hypothetical protein